MAKSKTKNGKKPQQQPLSPERFMIEKARKLPIGKCYITPDWQTSGISNIIITRNRPNGNHLVAIFLTDTFCLGVKDACYYVNMTEQEFDDMIAYYKSGPGLEEIGYTEVHNLIYGVIEFAEEGGIDPCKEFAIAEYILEEDTDDIPLIEYEYGKDGKHLLIVREKEDKKYIHILHKNLGENFDFISAIEDDDEYDNDDDELFEEQYSYNYPEYPSTLDVKNRFIAEVLFSKEYTYGLPKNIIEQILALPHDEAAVDISNIVMYEIGRTYSDINAGIIGENENGAIMHSVLLLTQLRDKAGLEAILELLHQSPEFADYHLGDFAPEILPAALYTCCNDDLGTIEKYLYEPGIGTYMRSNALETLTMVAVNQPERRPEIIEIFRRLLVSLPGRLENTEACDGSFAGFLMSYLMDIRAKELIPEIKAVFDTRYVDESVAGGLEDIMEEIQTGKYQHVPDRFAVPDIYEQYRKLKNCENNR